MPVFMFGDVVNPGSISDDFYYLFQNVPSHLSGDRISKSLGFLVL
jgi:hypothetical protein